MTAARCEHCGHYWAHNAGQRFLYITRFCPNCITRIGHRYP